MKTLMMLLTFLIAIILTSCSAGTVTEDYTKSPAMSSSIGEGRTNFQLNYKGKNYILIKNEVDGKYYAIPSNGGTK